MRKILFIFMIITLTNSGCKKNYNCVCTDANGKTLAVTTIKDTKGKANEKCTDYYNQNYGNVTFNQITCQIK